MERFTEILERSHDRHSQLSRGNASTNQSASLGRQMIAHATKRKNKVPASQFPSPTCSVSPSLPPITGVLLDMGFTMPHITTAIDNTGGFNVLLNIVFPLLLIYNIYKSYAVNNQCNVD